MFHLRLTNKGVSILKFIEADELLKKYDEDGEADKEFKRTVKDTETMNVGLRLRVCADFLDKKWGKLRDEREKLVESQGICCDFEKSV